MLGLLEHPDPHDDGTGITLRTVKQRMFLPCGELTNVDTKARPLADDFLPAELLAAQQNVAVELSSPLRDFRSDDFIFEANFGFTLGTDELVVVWVRTSVPFMDVVDNPGRRPRRRRSCRLSMRKRH